MCAYVRENSLWRSRSFRMKNFTKAVNIKTSKNDPMCDVAMPKFDVRNIIFAEIFQFRTSRVHIIYGNKLGNTRNCIWPRVLANLNSLVYCDAGKCTKILLYYYVVTYRV